jgi:hypothetical protein
MLIPYGDNCRTRQKRQQHPLGSSPQVVGAAVLYCHSMNGTFSIFGFS